MEWLTNYINFYYMLTFISAGYFTLNKMTVNIKISASWIVFILGAIIGIAWCFIDKETSPKVIITTFAIGTSFYELILKFVLEKLGWQKKVAK